MNSVPKLFSCSYADCWTEKHFSTKFGVLTSNHTHSHTLFWGCVSRWFGRALAWHARGQRFDPAILHQKSTVLRRKYGAFLLSRWHNVKSALRKQTRLRNIRSVGRAVVSKNHRPQLFESTRLASGKVITKQKLQYPVRILEFLVGAGGFEPPKLKSSRFTVCPHWPLGNTPISYLQSSLTSCIFYHLKWHLSTTFSTDFLFFCRSLFSCVLPQ